MSAKIRLSYTDPAELAAIREKLAGCIDKEKPEPPKRAFRRVHFYLKNIPTEKEDITHARNSD